MIARALADCSGYVSAFAAIGEEKVARDPVLEDIERLDQTPFVRVAELTFDRVGWVEEGEKA